MHTELEVRSSHGITLGKGMASWSGTDPAPNTACCDEEVGSGMEVHQG